MKDGPILAEGAPSDILDADIVTRLFGLPCLVVPDPVSGTPLMSARGRHHTGPTVVHPRRRTGIEPA